MENISKFDPPNFGWLQVKLSKEEMDFLWESIENKGEAWNSSLAGNIACSNLIDDKDNWFFNNVLVKLMEIYSGEYPQIWSIHNQFTGVRHPLALDTWWVNYQKKGEFNPLHKHSGKFSFVIFMKIPTEFEDQKREIKWCRESNSNVVSNFNFHYQGITGAPMTYIYEMGKWAEGTILFFPSELEHSVYPFYNCDEDRITISGNLLFDTSKTPEESNKIQKSPSDVQENKSTDSKKEESFAEERWWEREPNDNKWVSGGSPSSQGFGL